jgi:hypothetical protein
MRKKITAAIAVGIVLASFAVASPAMATGPGTPPTPSAPPGTSPVSPLNLSDPKVAAKDAEIRATGAKIISSTTVQYTAATSKQTAGAVHPDVFPSGCGLSVWIYQYPGYQQVDSSNLTSCLTPFSQSVMSGYISFWAFFNWNNILTTDTAEATGLESNVMDYFYKCVNGNTTSFRTVTDGQLWINGGYYTADAYDEIDDTPCGTS